MSKKADKGTNPILVIIITVIAAAIILGILLYPIVSDRLASGKDTTPAENTEPTQSTDSDQNTASDPNAAPDFKVYDMNGNAVTLSSKKGKPVIVNFFATWCPPCVGELPHFEEMYKEYGDKVEFMIVDLTDGYDETKEKVADFIEKNGYTFPVYLDSDINAVIAYNISSIPLTAFIDGEGKIVSSKVGAMNEETLEGYIKNLLGE